MIFSTCSVRPANRSFSLMGAPGVKTDPVWNDSVLRSSVIGMVTPNTVTLSHRNYQDIRATYPGGAPSRVGLAALFSPFKRLIAIRRVTAFDIRRTFNAGRQAFDLHR